MNNAAEKFVPALNANPNQPATTGQFQNERKSAMTLTTLRKMITSLAVAAALLLSAAQAAYVGTSAPTYYNPIEEDGLSGGPIDAFARYGFDALGNMCTGYIWHSPDHVITLGAFQPRLTLEVLGYGDTTLVMVHRASGSVYCDDDSGFDRSALLDLTQWPSGTYDVWVGSFWYDDYHDYTLLVYR